MARPQSPDLAAKAEKFLAKYAEQEKKDIKTAAVAIRPEMRPESAYKWGSRVLADPESRKKLMQIEQGAIAKVYDIVDDAIDTLAMFVRDPETPKMVRIKAVDMVLRRVLGGIPDTVILNKFSIFDGEGQKESLRDVLLKKMENATYERVIEPADAGLRTSQPETLKATPVAEESKSSIRRE